MKRLLVIFVTIALLVLILGPASGRGTYVAYAKGGICNGLRLAHNAMHNAGLDDKDPGLVQNHTLALNNNCFYF